MSANTKLRVAICGGGVGGLTLAVALSKAPNIEVDIYEAASEFAEIGAGVGVWPRTWKILQALGLADDLAAVADIPDAASPTFLFRRGDTPDGGATFEKLYTPGGMLGVHRPDFQRVLLAHLARRCRTHTAKRLASYTDSDAGALRLHFADGTRAACDVLVGADGIRSAVRACMLERTAAARRAQGDAGGADAALRGVRARWSGTMAYRATVPADALRARFPGHRVLAAPHVYLGRNSEMTIYPIACGKLVNFAAFTACYERENTDFDGPSVEDVPRAQFVKDFESWEPEIQALLDCVPTTSRWAVHTVVPLDSFVSGRVILLGDAAHAMMPYQGSGAGQAIEDAYVLAALLAHPHATSARLERVAHIYDAVRRPVAQRVAAASREAGLLYTLNYPGLTLDGGARGGDAEQLREIFRRLCENWRWAWETTVDEDVRRAVAMLEEWAGP